LVNKRIREKFAFFILNFTAFITVGILFIIVGYILVNGLRYVSLDFLLNEPERMGKEGGIFSVIISTIYLVFFSIIIAAPIGIFAAIYLNEYAKKNKFLGIIRYGTEILAGIPSIIFGLFGFVFFVVLLGFRWSILSGALTLAMMILPTIIRTSEESIKSIPFTYREGSYALGATKWQTIYKVIIPTALPGIVTGIILSIGRAIGETAAVLLTAGSALGVPKSIFDPARSMSVHLYILASEGLSKQNTFATATVLIIVVLLINFIANIILNRFNRRFI